MSELNERFGLWYGQILPDLIRHNNRLSPLTDPEDAAQKAGIAAYVLMMDKGLDVFPSLEAFRKWCLVRSRWEALGDLRKFHRHFEELTDVDMTVFAEKHSGEDDSLDEPLGKTAAVLYKAVGRLPTKQKIVMDMKIAGKTTRQIADELHVKETSIRSLLRFARRRLAKQLLALDESKT